MTNVAQDVGCGSRDRSAGKIRLPPSPQGEGERVLVAAIARVVHESFGQSEKWFRGVSETEAEMIACEALQLAKKNGVISCQAKAQARRAKRKSD